MILPVWAPVTVILSSPAPKLILPEEATTETTSLNEPVVKAKFAAAAYATSATAAVVAVAATACLPNCTKLLKSEAVEPVNVNSWLVPNTVV